MYLHFIYLIQYVFSTRLSQNSELCSKYLEKFNDNINEQGVIYSNLNLSVNAYFIKDSGDIYFNITYNDYNFKSKFYGLVQEDGKKEEDTCLDLKIFQQHNIEQNVNIHLTNLQINSSCNCQTKQRFYSFFLNIDQLNVSLIRTANQVNFLITGQFKIAFTSAETGQIVKFFPYKLKITNKNQIELPEKKPDIQFGCEVQKQCQSNISSTIKQCTDCTCQKFFSEAYACLNDYFVLLQEIEMVNFHVFKTELILTASGLHKKGLVKKIDNSIQGQVKILVKATIAWDYILLLVSSSNDICKTIENQSLCAEGNISLSFLPYLTDANGGVKKHEKCTQRQQIDITKCF